MPSSQINVTLVESPRIILIPEFSLGVPVVKLLFKSIMLSASEIVSELTVVVVPETVKFPVIVQLSLTVTTPEPLAESVKLVSVDLLSIASTSMLLANVIAFPAELVILIPSSICSVDLTAISPEPVAFNSTLPEPLV